MSDFHPDAADPSNDSDDFIKLDMGDGPTVEPALPTWVATLLVAIGAVVPLPYDVAFAALESLLGPVMPGGAQRATFEALPEATKARVRAAKDAKMAELRRERDRARQAIPVVRPADVPAPAPVLGTAEPGSTLVATPGEDAPVNGTWTRIQSGPLAGSWGARVECSSMQVGRMVRLYKRGAQRGTLHVVERFGQREPGVWVCRVRDANDAEIARLRAPAASSQPIPVMTEDAGSGPVETIGESSQEPAGTVESALAGAAEQGTTLAASQAPSYERTVEPTTRGNGEAQAFATNATTNNPTGPSYFDRPRAERTGFRVGDQSTGQTTSGVRKLIAERDFIAGAVAEGSMLQVSWTGGGETTCGAVDSALVAIERENDAPERKSALAYAGDAVDAMKNRMYDTARLPNSELPDGIKARWIVGRKLSGREINAGDAYGTALLVVSLKDDDTLAFDGDLALASQVRSRYATATAKQILKSDTLTSWLGRILRTRHGAVKRGHVWYVPGGQADAARALIDAISPLWGDHEHIPVTTGPDLFRSLTRGLLCEAQAIEIDLHKSTVLARAAARKQAEKTERERFGATDASVTAAGDLAERRGTVSSVVAARLLRELGDVAARVGGYEAMLGADAVASVKNLIAVLRRTLEPLTDDTSARAAMLELD